MIIYKRKKKQLIIPCGLGPVVCEDPNYELELKQVDSSTVLQQVEPDEGYYGLYRVIVNPYTVEWKNRPITGNGTYVITPENADALSGVEINVDVQANLQEKTVDSSTVSQTVSPDNDYDGLSRVNVNPYTLESKSQVITANGEYTVTPSGADGLSSVDISVNVADIPAVLQEKTVDSSTENQAITPDEGYDGLSQVNVNPYTLESKSDTITDNGMYTYYPNTADGLDQVTIDVSVDTVNNQSKTVDSSTEMQYVQPDQGYTGLDYVAVNPYTLDSKTVDSSTVSQTIVSDEDGLSSVTVNPYTLESKSDTLTANGQYVYTADNADALSQVSIDVSINTVNNQSKTADSSTVSQAITPDQGYTGLDSVTINPYVLDSKTVDSSTVSQTIVSDDDGLSSVTVNPYVLDSKTVNSSTSQQVITSDEDGLSSVTVNPYTLESKSDTLTANGQYTYTADNADALSEVTIDVSINTVNNQSKTVDSSTVGQAITPDQGYTGLDSVTVNPYVLDNKTVNPSTNVQVVTSDEDGLSSVTVNPYVLDSKTVDSSTVTQVVTSDEDGLSSVTVNPYTTESDSSVLTHNGQYIFTPENADALSQVTVDVSINTVNNQSKAADSSTVSQNITPDSGYTGLDSVTINPYVLDNKTVNSSTSQQVITSDEDGLSSVTVNPYVLDSKTVDSSTVTQVVTSDEDGLSSVTVNPYVINNQDKELKVSGYYFDLDSSITADAGYDGLNSVKINMPDSGYYIVQAFGKGGYTMNVNRYIPMIEVRDLSLQSKTLSSWGPGTDSSILPDDGYDGFTDIKILDQYSALRVKPLAAELIWDSGLNKYVIPTYESIVPKKNVTSILLDYVLLQSNKTVDASTVSQTVTFDEWDSSLLTAYDASADPDNLITRYQGLKQVTVNPVTASIDSNIQAGNIKNGVTILGVTGSYSGGGSDYVIAARKGTMTDLSGYTLDAVTRDNQYRGLFQYAPITKIPTLPDPGNYRYVYNTAFHNCTSLSGAIDLSNVTNIANETFRDAFTYAAITSVDMSNVTSIGNYGAYGMFYSCSRLASFDLSSLTTVGDNGLYQTFSGCTALTSVDLPELTSVGYYGMANAFYNCRNLTTVNMPKLTNTGTYGMYYAFYNTNVQTCTIHPDALTSSNSNYNPLYYMTSLVTLNLSQKVTKNCYINHQANLSAASIQGILEKLDLSVSGKTITFSNNTVIDTEAKEYSTPYNAAIAAGWTIYNLTVIPFVTLKVNAPANGLLNLKNSSTIDFDSESAWTVTTSDPSVHVSQASGAAGTGIQLTVTYDSGYSGDSTITIANQYDSVQITARYNAETYTRLEYITNVQGQEGTIELPNNILNKDSVIQFTVNYRSHNGNRFLSTTVADGYTEEWRIFGYSNSLYTDIGGGSGGGRYYNAYTFGAINGQFGTIEVGINSSNCTYQKNVSTGDTYTSSSPNSFNSTAPYYLNYTCADGEKTWLRELKVYINGLDNGLTYDYVAAKDSNDVPGLWDMIRDEFYTNSNGRIAAGPVLSV